MKKYAATFETNYDENGNFALGVCKYDGTVWMATTYRSHLNNFTTITQIMAEKRINPTMVTELTNCANDIVI